MYLWKEASERGEKYKRNCNFGNAMGHWEITHWRCHRAQDRWGGHMLLRLREDRVFPGRKVWLQPCSGKGVINQSPDREHSFFFPPFLTSQRHFLTLHWGRDPFHLVSNPLERVTSSLPSRPVLWHKMALESERVEFKHHILHLVVPYFCRPSVSYCVKSMG